MPYYLIWIRGYPARAAGLLAKAGIQNVVSEDAEDAKDAPARGDVAARLSAESAELALERVRQTLEGEPFTVEAHAHLEQGADQKK
jgi:hypothetical protein